MNTFLFPEPYSILSWLPSACLVPPSVWTKCSRSLQLQVQLLVLPSNEDVPPHLPHAREPSLGERVALRLGRHRFQRGSRRHGPLMFTKAWRLCVWSSRAYGIGGGICNQPWVCRRHHRVASAGLVGEKAQRTPRRALVDILCGKPSAMKFGVKVVCLFWNLTPLRLSSVDFSAGGATQLVDCCMEIFNLRRAHRAARR